MLHYKDIFDRKIVFLFLFFYSVEWDILMVPVKYNEEYYDCCPEPYPDLTFNITMRRKTLFYTGKFFYFLFFFVK